MSMKALEGLREMLCEELDEIAKKQEMSAGDLEAVHKLTDTIKNIDKIEMFEGGEYSQAGGSSYRSRNSSRGSSSRSGGRYSGERRDSRGRYSRSGGRERMVDHLEQMLDEADTEREREAIRRCMEQLENA